MPAGPKGPAPVASVTAAKARTTRASMLVSIVVEGRNLRNPLGKARLRQKISPRDPSERPASGGWARLGMVEPFK